MQVLKWFKKQKKENTVVKTEYVLVTIDGYRPRSERWCDPEYLQLVANFCENKVYTLEVFDVIDDLRVMAATCNNPDTLKGINECLRKVARLRTAPVEAKKALIEIEMQKGLMADATL